MPEEIKNAALFLRLGLRSTLIHHENEAFWKRSLNRRNLKLQLFFPTVTPTVYTNPSRKRNFSKTLFKLEEVENAGRVDGKHFENEAFSNAMTTSR